MDKDYLLQDTPNIVMTYTETGEHCQFIPKFYHSDKMGIDCDTINQNATIEEKGIYFERRLYPKNVAIKELCLKKCSTHLRLFLTCQSNF